MCGHTCRVVRKLPAWNHSCIALEDEGSGICSRLRELVGSRLGLPAITPVAIGNDEREPVSVNEPLPTDVRWPPDGLDGTFIMLDAPGLVGTFGPLVAPPRPLPCTNMPGVCTGCEGYAA